jgi:hypothetical protein
MGAGGIMTAEEMEARSRQSDELTEKIGKFVIAQKARMDVASIAFMNLLGAAIMQTFGEQAATDFLRTMDDFIASHQQAPDEKKFWNLMAEKGYDLPVAFGSKKKAKGMKANG